MMLRMLLVLALLAQDAPPAPPSGRAKQALEEARALLKGAEQAAVVFRQLDPETPPGPGRKQLHGWTVVREQALDAKKREEVRAILLDGSTYGELGAKCFIPGMGLTFTPEGSPFDLVICLKCSWIYVYQGKPELKHSWALSPAGVERLMKLYLSQAGDAKK
jgi:hypothetical protein